MERGLIAHSYHISLLTALPAWRHLTAKVLVERDATERHSWRPNDRHSSGGFLEQLSQQLRTASHGMLVLLIQAIIMLVADLPLRYTRGAVVALETSPGTGTYKWSRSPITVPQR